MLNKFEAQLAYLRTQVPSPLVLNSLYSLRDTLSFVTETDLRVSACNINFHRACTHLVNLELAVQRAIHKVQGALRAAREGQGGAVGAVQDVAHPAVPRHIDEGVRNLRQGFSDVLEQGKVLASLAQAQAPGALRDDSAAHGAPEGQPMGMDTGGAQKAAEGMPEGLEQGAAPWPFGSKPEAGSLSQLKYVWIVHTSTATYICADQLEAVRTFNACEHPEKFMARVREDYVEAIRKVRQGLVSGNIRIELSDEPFHKSPYSFLNFK